MQFSCKRNIKAISGDRKQNVCVFLTLWMSITNITGAPGSHTWLHKSDVSARPDVYNLPPLCRFVTSYLDHFHIRTVSMDVAIKNLVRHWGNVGKGMGKWSVKSLKYFFVLSNTNSPKKNHGIRTTRKEEIAPLIHCSDHRYVSRFFSIISLD